MLSYSSGGGLSSQEQKDWAVEIQLPNPYLPQHHLTEERRDATIHITYSTGPFEIYLMGVASFNFVKGAVSCNLHMATYLLEISFSHSKVMVFSNSGVPC